MTNYTATIRHHSISRAREIDCGPNLTEAKRRASKEFGDEFRDYVISIYREEGDRPPELAASRRVDEARWQDHYIP